MIEETHKILLNAYEKQKELHSECSGKEHKTNKEIQFVK